MSDRIPILQIPRALSATEKRVYDRLRSGDTPDRICMEMHLYPDRYAELVQSIRSKGHNPDQKEVEKMEWTAEEKRILIQMKKEGATNAQIAEKLGRNKGQVAVKYSTMMKSAQRDPETSAPPAPAPASDPVLESIANVPVPDTIYIDDPKQPARSIPDVVMQALTDARDRLRTQLEAHRNISRNIEQNLMDLDDYIDKILGA